MNMDKKIKNTLVSLTFDYINKKETNLMDYRLEDVFKLISGAALKTKIQQSIKVNNEIERRIREGMEWMRENGRENFISSFTESTPKNKVYKVVTDLSNTDISDLKSEYAKLKMGLGFVAFHGTFHSNKRHSDYLKNRSGLMVLDFDYWSNAKAKEVKDKLRKDPYILACWYSPSRRGVKALVKIGCNLEDVYKGVFDYYSSYDIDTSGKDIARACYMSRDKNIFINWDSRVFMYSVKSDKKEFKKPIVPLPVKGNEDKIYTAALRAAKNSDSSKEGRNNFCFLIGAFFCDFGLSEFDAISCAQQNVNNLKDFSIRELETAVKSGYKKGVFGSKELNDDLKEDLIRQAYVTGKDPLNVFKNTPKGVISKVVQKEKEEPANFYTVKKGKDGSISISEDPIKLRRWFKIHGFFREDKPKLRFLHVQQNIVKEINPNGCRDYILDQFNKAPATDVSLLKLKDIMRRTGGMFTVPGLGRCSSLTSKRQPLIESKEHGTHLLFKNVVIKIKDGQVSKVNYPDLKGFVMFESVSDRVYNKGNFEDSVVHDFFLRCMGTQQGRTSLMSTIGCALKGFREVGDRAAIFNDDNLSGGSNGRRGKSLVVAIINQIRNVLLVSGKQLAKKGANNQFYLSGYKPGVHNLVVIDDAVKGHSLEQHYTNITGPQTIEKKGQDVMTIPFKRSPFYVITTNHLLKGFDASDRARRNDLFFSDYFSDEHTPMLEYGSLFFNNWQQNQWDDFHDLMIECIRIYQANGIIQHEPENLKNFKAIMSIGASMYDAIRKFLKDAPGPVKVFTTDEFKSFLKDDNSFYEKHTIRDATIRKAIKNYIKWMELEDKTKVNGDNFNFYE